jgi:hypothetical protein
VSADKATVRSGWAGSIIATVDTTGGGLFLVSLPNYSPLLSTLSKMYDIIR